MPRIALQIEYLGQGFCGSQYQLGVRTVQEELEKALSILGRQKVTAIFSGRTDSGVHARGQVVHCDWADDDLDLIRFCWALNGILPNDICVHQAQGVPDLFHARYKAIRREYVYRVWNSKQRSALLRHTHHFVSLPLDLESMQEAAQVLLGEHDFKAFKSSSNDSESTICQVYRSELLNIGEGKLEFWIAGNRFVYNMVRIIAGTLLLIGLGKKKPQSMIETLNSADRDLAGPTAPPSGLCLDSVKYPDAYRLFVPNDNCKKVEIS